MRGPGHLRVAAHRRRRVKPVGTTLEQLGRAMLRAAHRKLGAYLESSAAAESTPARAQEGAEVREREAQRSRLEIEQIFASSPLALMVLDREMRFRRVSQEVEVDFGLPASALLGKAPRDVLPPELASATERLLRPVVERGEAQRAVELLGRVGPAGERDWLINAFPLRSEAGELVGASVIALDITERKRAEAALAASRAQLQAVLESTADVVWSVDARRFGLLTFNRRFRELVGAGAQVGATPEEMHPRLGPLWRTYYERALREGPFSTEVQGERFDVRWQIRVYPMLLDGTALGLSVFARDITVEAHLQQELREAREHLEEQVVERTAELESTRQRLSLLLENSPLAVLEFSMPEYRITRWSSEATRMFGWSADEALGKPTTALQWGYAEDLPRVFALLKDILEGKTQRAVMKNRNLRKDGAVIDCEWYVSCVIGPDGRAVAVLCLVLEVTERKRTEAERQRLDEERVHLLSELRAANARLTELDRLKSMFIANVSHELRTPLNSILGFTGIILQGIVGEINAEQRKQLAMVKASAEHLLALITDIIDVSKIEAGIADRSDTRFSLTDLSREVVESVVGARVRPLVPIGVVADGPYEIVSDARRVRQILMNLLSNAVKFTDRGRITLTLSAREGGLEVAVRDTGIGVAPEDMPKLFLPFQQIRVVGRAREGTGLGLHLSRKLAELLGGTLCAESELGVGSVFRLWLPDGGPSEAASDRRPES